MGIHDGHRERLKKAFIENGLESMNEIQALELLMFFSVARRDTNELAHALLDRFGSLDAIFHATAEDLMEDMGWLDKLPDVGHNNESSAQSGAQLSAAERLVMNQLDKGELGFEQLCDRTNLPAAMLSATISMLQIRGLIRLLPGKRYESVTEKQ